jgi:hypothetical protein
MRSVLLTFALAGLFAVGSLTVVQAACYDGHVAKVDTHVATAPSTPIVIPAPQETTGG